MRKKKAKTVAQLAAEMDAQAQQELDVIDRGAEYVAKLESGLNPEQLEVVRQDRKSVV